MTAIKVFCARSMSMAVRRLADQFVRDNGHEVDITFAPVGALSAKLAAGETTDVLILGASAMTTMEQEGSFVAGTRTDVSRVHIGVAVREGAPAPDISTPDAFRAALLATRTIAVVDPSVGGTAAVFLPGLFERMGIAEEIKRKALPQRNGAAVAEAVASGEAELGLTLIPEMVPVKGAHVIGKLPAALADSTIYTAAVTAGSRAPDAASAFIAALVHPSTRDVWQAAGFEQAG